MRGRNTLDGSLTLILVLAATACSGRESLGAPTPVSPAAGTVFDVFPRRTQLVWTRVPGAVTYTVEVDPYCTDRARWCSEVGATQLVYTAAGIPDTTHTFDHVGAQPGRWRVWAVDRAGSAGPKTEWSRFEHRR